MRFRTKIENIERGNAVVAVGVLVEHTLSIDLSALLLSKNQLDAYDHDHDHDHDHESGELVPPDL